MIVVLYIYIGSWENMLMHVANRGRPCHVAPLLQYLMFSVFSPNKQGGGCDTGLSTFFFINFLCKAETFNCVSFIPVPSRHLIMPQ